MTDLLPITRFAVDGLEFTGSPFRGRPGYYVTDIEGILSGGAVASQSIPLGATGAADTQNRRDDERIITLRGFGYDHSAAAVASRVDQLSGVLAANDSVGNAQWSVYGVQRRTKVRRGRVFEVRRRRRAPMFIDFTLLFRAPDQRVYGLTPEGMARHVSEWGRTVSVDHFGTFPAPARIDVRRVSGAGGYTISGPGGLAIISTPLAVGDSHLYDADLGVLYIGGVAQETGVDRSDPIAVPQGIHSITVSAGCEIRVSFPPTYAP